MDAFYLSGEWQLFGTDESGNGISCKVSVPGYVHDALQNAGIIPPMFFNDNAKQCQWCETREWTFEKVFDAPKSRAGRKRVLHLDGIDTYADVYLNGIMLGSSKNMFVPFTADVGDILKAEGNLLKVVIHPYAEMIKGKPLVRRAVFRNDRIHVRRVQCTFWWDWVERFVSAGLWRDVYIDSEADAVLDGVYAYTADIVPTSAAVKIKFTALNAIENRCRFEVALTDPDGTAVWSDKGAVFLREMCFDANIRNPKLWWPNGYGDQPLYTLSVSLYSDEGVLLDRHEEKIGIRTLRIEMLRDEPGSAEAEFTDWWRRRCKNRHDSERPGESMTVLVNGVRIYLKGGDWVPPSPFPGTRTDGDYEKLISLAASSNMNMLRVWGGGVFEPDVFYDLCDRYGILLMHDFLLACGNYPDDDPEFVENLRAEIHYNVKHLRNHASIGFWSGNNENCDNYSWDDPEMRNVDLVRDVFIPELDVLDPERPFRISSPYGGNPNDDYAIGDNHASWWWTGAENIDCKMFDRVGRFTTESPLEGYPLKSQLKKFLSKENIDPESPVLDYHIKNNPYLEMQGLLSVHGRLKKNTEVILGDGGDTDRRLFLYSYIQYEWARLTIEGARRSKYYNSGLLFWMYNDCWPALGYAVVDYYCRPKSGWYASRRAFAPIAASISEKDGHLCGWCLNDGNKNFIAEYRFSVYDANTGNKLRVHTGTVDSAANENTVLFDGEKTDYGCKVIAFLELKKDGVTVDRARWYDGWLKDNMPAPAKIETSVDTLNSTFTVKCLSGIALGIAADGNFTAEDNFFDLLEGETKTVKFLPDGDFNGISFYCINGQT